MPRNRVGAPIIVVTGPSIRPLLARNHPLHRLCKPTLARLLRPLIQLGKPRMIERLLRRTAHLRPQLQHLSQQLHTHAVDDRENLPQLLRRVDGPGGLIFRERANPRPRAFGGRAHEPEDFEQLVLVRRAREEWSTREHLRHDAPGAPDVDAGVVGTGAEEDVGRAVPQCHDFVAEGVDGDAEGAREAEIGEFELALVVDEEVLGLEITM